ISWRSPTFTRSSNSAATTVTGDRIGGGVYRSGGTRGERSLPPLSPRGLPRKIPRKSHVKGDVKPLSGGHYSGTPVREDWTGGKETSFPQGGIGVRLAPRGADQPLVGFLVLGTVFGHAARIRCAA